MLSAVMNSPILKAPDAADRLSQHSTDKKTALAPREGALRKAQQPKPEPVSPQAIGRPKARIEACRAKQGDQKPALKPAGRNRATKSPH